MRCFHQFIWQILFLFIVHFFIPSASASIGFTEESFSATEDSSGINVSIEVDVNDFGRDYLEIIVDYSVSSGTAKESIDFIAVSGTFYWDDNEIQTFQIPIIADDLTELDETVIVAITNCIVVLPNESSVPCSAGETLLSSNTAVAVIIGSALEETNELTPNQQAIVETIAETCDSATDDLLLRCQEIYDSGLTDVEILQAIDSISPEQISAQGNIAVDFGFQQLQMVHGRIVNLRQSKGGSSRMSLSGFTMNSFGQHIPIGQIAQSAINSVLGGAAGDDNSFRDSPIGLFLKGQIDIGDKKSTDAETGFDVEAKSITLGLDYQFSDHLVVGIAGGYGHNNTEFLNNTGEMETHSGNFSIYGSYFLPQNYYIDVIFSYAIDDYDNVRTIAYPGLQTSAISNPQGDQYGGSIGFGKDFYLNSFFFSPYARVEYLRTGIDEYSEQGGGGFALRVAEQSMFSLATTLGGQMSHAFGTPWGVISPGMRFEWRHQFRNDQRTIQSEFIDTPVGIGSFSTETSSPDRDYFNLEASVAFTLAEGRSAFIRYESRLGQDDLTNHTIEATIRLPF